MGLLDTWFPKTRENLDETDRGQPPPTDERVWHQVIYSAITDFLEANLQTIEEFDASLGHYADYEDAVGRWLQKWEATDPDAEVPTGSPGWREFASAHIQAPIQRVPIARVVGPKE